MYFVYVFYVFCFLLLFYVDNFVFVFVFVFCILFFITKFKVKIKAIFCFLNYIKQSTTYEIQRLAAYTRLHPLTLTPIYTFFKVT